MAELVDREDDNGLTTLTLNRPDKLNALNVAVFEALRRHVDIIATQSESVGVVVVRGAGKCFSAGHDLADLAEETEASLRFEGATIERLANLPQVVISAVHGHCYTGALELALAGDLIAASESAKFADTHAKWAVTPIWGMTQRLPRRVGLSKAREMMFTCRAYDSAAALAMGLANFRFPDAGFDSAVRGLGREILAQSWFTHRANKQALLETDGLSLGQGLGREVYRTGPDMQARISTFMTKAKR
ncbi:MAG: enoyl-CoA hydratase/isomerase family protein [Rhodospirillaceae bacterium]|nr:enoyl-CoA hydratase/isomerase family protein [Rhodospirillaceae bacterium]